MGTNELGKHQRESLITSVLESFGQGMQSNLDIGKEEEKLTFQN